MAYYRNYYDHQSECGDEQSIADSQTDLYSGYNTQFHPHRQDGSPMVSGAVLDHSSRHTRKNRNHDRAPRNHRTSSFVTQDFNYFPENSYNYQQPRNSRRRASFINDNLMALPDEYHQYYHDHQQQARRWGSHRSNKQNDDYPITPENEENGYFYHDPSAEEVANYPAAMNQNDGLYVEPESQHSEATLEEEYDEDDDEDDDDDDDDMSFIEDTTTQRNTLINSEPSAPVTDSYKKQTMSPTVGNVVSPLPSSQQHQQQQAVEALVNQHNPNAAVVSKPGERRNWFKSIIKTALCIKKKAQKFKRGGISVQQQQQQTASSPTIQVIPASSNAVLDDVLDSRQQQELITQLRQSPSPAPGSNANLLPEKTKITSLDRIWVFRLQEEANNATDHRSNIAWIGFDFENQLKIEEHLKELENRPEDGRLALYDSHIRHKTMPVIVAPNDKKGYYFADMHQNELITLEITFIENDHQKVTFVYRV